MIEAGCTVIGGHSIRDEETKFGYSVTGTINPKHVLKNGGARAGDRLLLTKALGTGVISTAIKKDVAKQAWIDAAVRSMTTLNKDAAEVISGFMRGNESQSPHPPLKGKDGAPHSEAHDEPPVHALTDVTGFGLIGHLREMLLASNDVSATIHASRVPLLEGALECVRAGHVPGGLKANREFAECVVHYDDAVPQDFRTILFDPQTAGGLLISVARDAAVELRNELVKTHIAVAEIGEMLESPKSHITVVT
jgi:selenide,water dikinase